MLQYIADAVEVGVAPVVVKEAAPFAQKEQGKKQREGQF